MRIFQNIKNSKNKNKMGIKNKLERKKTGMIHSGTLQKKDRIGETRSRKRKTIVDNMKSQSMRRINC